MRAWIFQNSKQQKQLGDNAPWIVGWIDPEGRRKSKTIGAESRAKKFARKIEGQLAAGTYEGYSRKTWQDFRQQFDERVIDGMESGTAEAYRNALDHFQRVIAPKRLQTITSETIDGYTAKRLKEKRSPKGEKTVSRATVNKELRHIRRALRTAHRWKWLPVMPEFVFLKEAKKLPPYVTPEDFAKLYDACDHAVHPKLANITATDWWRALLVMAYMTGWRIKQLMYLAWQDVNLQTGVARTQAEDNKGRRDDDAPLHPFVMEHLERIQGFSVDVFPWPNNRRTLWTEFYRIQKAAGVKPPGKARYGFHDLRRAFATMNADRMTADALQRLMQHKSYQTTQRYINMSRQVNQAVEKLFVPDVTTKTGGIA